MNWRLNDQSIESNDRSLISTTCDDYSCTSKLVYNSRTIHSSKTNLHRLSCIAENEYGTEQSRLYQISSNEDPSTILIPILLSIFLLIIILSIVATCCGCRARQRRKRSSKRDRIFIPIRTLKLFSAKKLPVVYDAHYSINELIKDVGCLRTANIHPCHTLSNDNDRLSLKIEQSRIEPTGNVVLHFSSVQSEVWIFRSFINIIIQ